MASPGFYTIFDVQHLAAQAAPSSSVPWGSNKGDWQADEHERYDQSPCVLVIPPRVIHTSQDVGEGTTWLIDVFGPPRMDFSSRPGFVLNAADYPMPPQS